MEGSGFEGTRDPGRAGPSFEPPADPAGGPSIHGLSLVARIMRGRELATAAAGVPPLDSDQVLDLQRTAGNQLTAGALSRWTDGIVDAIDSEAAAALGRLATPEEALRRPPAELLDHLLPARAADPAIHAAICAALDARDPSVVVRLTCTAAGAPAEFAVRLRGPAGEEAGGTAELAAGAVVKLELRFSAAFGPAAAVAPDGALELRLTGPDGSQASVELPVPFVAPRTLALAGARFVALAELA